MAVHYLGPSPTDWVSIHGCGDYKPDLLGL